MVLYWFAEITSTGIVARTVVILAEAKLAATRVVLRYINSDSSIILSD
jgi:hypothetical protein